MSVTLNVTVTKEHAVPKKRKRSASNVTVEFEVLTAVVMKSTIFLCNTMQSVESQLDPADTTALYPEGQYS